MQETVAASDLSRAYTLQIVTDTDPELSPFSAIIITGGTTYRLRHLLHASGLNKVLSQAICSGTPVYGVSAGAVVLGADIDTSVDKHPEYIASDGLDLIQGNSVLCHYADDRDEHLQRFLQTKRLPVIAIPDDETVRFDGERFYSALGDRMGRALWAQR
jgi:dipeptidase E